MKPSSRGSVDVPLQMVGSTKFGRYPQISLEQTVNMIISDEWNVPTPGYVKTTDLSGNGEGRGIFSSVRLNGMIAVEDNQVFLISNTLAATPIATLDTDSGDVFIAENDASQIALCDRTAIYIYDYSLPATTFTKIDKDVTGFRPGHISFQDGYFISVDLERPQWRLSALNNGLSWPAAPNNVGSFQTKADSPLATIPIPGKANQLFVMGGTVTESWTDVGYRIFPYQRSTGFNIDYGCVNPATIAKSDTFVIWLGKNEKSGLAIMYSSGGPVKQISNDGIDFRLASLENPLDAYGFLYRQDGHLIYQITFPTDNLTYIYDFETQRFFTLTDEKGNHHIAKEVAFFNDKYYFISFNNGGLYEMSSKYTTYEGAVIPRLRVPPTTRLKDASGFVGESLAFTVEQGHNDDLERIDLSLSTDGGYNFGSTVETTLNSLGNTRSRFTQYGFGYMNTLTLMFRFWGNGRFLINDGIITIRQ